MTHLARPVRLSRRIRFAGPEHQFREIHALDVHHSEGISYYGNGQTVMMVAKNNQHGPRVDIVGENGLNMWGDPFRYADSFEYTAPSSE